MTNESCRAQVVAQFLAENPRHLELGLDVEAGLRHLRKEVNDRLNRELELAGWTRRSGGWVSSLPDWPSKTWSGVWLWHPSAESLDFTVGVEGWPESAAHVKSALEGAFRRASSQHPDAWAPHPQNARWTNKIQWEFRRANQLLGNDRERGIQQIMALVSALVEAAGSP